MKQFFIYIKSSFDTHSVGASARKLTAWAITSCVVSAHIFWIRFMFIKSDFTTFSTILPIDFMFISALLGMTTYESVQKNKKDGSKDDEPAA